MGGGGEIFNNRSLFSLLFSGNSCGGDKVWMEGTKAVMGGSPQSPPLVKNLFHLNVLAGQKHFVLTAQLNNTVSAYSKCISQRKPSY